MLRKTSTEKTTKEDKMRFKEEKIRSALIHFSYVGKGKRKEKLINLQGYGVDDEEALEKLIDKAKKFIEEQKPKKLDWKGTIDHFDCKRITDIESGYTTIQETWFYASSGENNYIQINGENVLGFIRK